MERFFKLKQNNTNVKTEIFAGITTFMTMAYILIVNPSVLSGLQTAEGFQATGMDKGAVFTATALAAVIGTLVMALVANYPFALAPGMGLNAFFAYTVVLGYKHDWKIALAAVLIEGIVFLILTFINVREALFNAIPMNLKYAVSAGIGLFIAFIGLQNAGIVVADASTLVGIGKMTEPAVILSVIGLIVMTILVSKKVKGSILLGILITWIVGMIAEAVGIFDPQFSVIPDAIFSAPPSLEPIAFKFDFSIIGTFEFWIIVFSFLFVDLFDTLGTLIGVSSKAGYLDKEGKLPRIKHALFADSVATVAGACLGTSTTTTYVESASGVADGGRTGLTSFTTAVLFALALFFSPLLLTVPTFATAPALIVVGFYMMESIAKVDFTDYTQAIPAFLAILVMPLTYSISEGIVFGVISYTVINLVVNKGKKVHPLMYVLTILFILKYIFL